MKTNWLHLRLYSDWFLVVNLCIEIVLLFSSRCGAYGRKNAIGVRLRESIE